MKQHRIIGIGVGLAIALPLTLTGCGGGDVAGTRASNTASSSDRPSASAAAGTTAGVSTSTGSSRPTSTAAGDSHVVANYVGRNLKDARAALERFGFTVEVKSDSGKSVLAESNWTVTSQSPAAGGESQSVELTVTKKAADASANSQGLTATNAQVVCDDYAERVLPRAKLHWTTGSLAEELRGEAWFKKVKATTADGQDVEVECLVGGSPDAPTVTSFQSY